MSGFFSGFESIVLGVTAIVALCWLVLGSLRPKLATAFVVCLAIYALIGLVNSLSNPFDVEAAKVGELKEFDGSLRAEEMGILAFPKSTNNGPSKVSEYLDATLKTIDSIETPNCRMLARKAIALWRQNKDFQPAIDALQRCGADDGLPLAHDLDTTLSGSSGSNNLATEAATNTSSATAEENETAEETAADLNRRLDDSWFRDRALESLYKKFHQTEKLNAFDLQQTKRSKNYILNLITLIIANAAMAIASLVVIVWQVVSQFQRRSEEGGLWPLFPCSTKTALAIGLAFLAMHNASRHAYFAGAFLFSLDSFDALKAALQLTEYFIVTAYPVILLIYLFVLRPNKIALRDGLMLRLQTDRAQPDQMVLTGIFTFIAISGISISLALFQSLLHLKTDEGQIQLLIESIVKSGSPMAIAIAFITLTIVVPLADISIFCFGYRYLRQKYSWPISIALVTVYYGLMYFDPPDALRIMALGAVLAYSCERTRSAVPAVIAKVLLNAFWFGMVMLAKGY